MTIVSLFSLFLAGLFLSLTPCMLPTLPILYLMIVGPDSTQKYLRVGTFIAANAFCYALVGVAVALWGIYIQIFFQQWYILASFSLLLFILALFQMEILHFPATYYTKYAAKASLASVAIMGALSTLVASPCITPALGGILAYLTESRDILMGILGLLALNIGINIPLIAITLFGDRIMSKLKQGMKYSKIILSIGLIGLSGFFGVKAFNVFTHNTAQPTATTLTVVKKAESPVQMLFFTAEWCPYCHDMKNVLKQLPVEEQRLLTGISFVDNTNGPTELNRKYHVYGLPSIVLLKDGKMVASSYGLIPLEQLRALIHKGAAHE